MARSSDPQTVRQWQGRMARFKKSPLTVLRFCRDEGVSVPSFYQWRKKLQQQARVVASDDAAANFRPVRLVGSAHVVVRWPGGTQLEVPTGDPQALRLAMQMLAEVDARRVAGETPC